MKNIQNYTGFMGLTPDKIEMYNREYARTNPHNLPGIRNRRRRIVRSEFVYSSQTGTKACAAS